MPICSFAKRSWARSSPENWPISSCWTETSSPAPWTRLRPRRSSKPILTGGSSSAGRRLAKQLDAHSQTHAQAHSEVLSGRHICNPEWRRVREPAPRVTDPSILSPSPAPGGRSLLILFEFGYAVALSFLRDPEEDRAARLASRRLVTRPPTENECSFAGLRCVFGPITFL